MASKRGADARIVAGIVGGRPRAETAEQAGISERTLRRRMQDPSVLSAIAEARLQLHEQVVGWLQQLAFKAVEQFDSVMNSGSDAARVTAARTVLDQIGSFEATLESVRLSAMAAVQDETLAQLEVDR